MATLQYKTYLGDDTFGSGAQTSTKLFPNIPAGTRRVLVTMLGTEGTVLSMNYKNVTATVYSHESRIIPISGSVSAPTSAYQFELELDKSVLSQINAAWQSTMTSVYITYWGF